MFRPRYWRIRPICHSEELATKNLTAGWLLHTGGTSALLSARSFASTQDDLLRLDRLRARVTLRESFPFPEVLEGPMWAYANPRLR